MEDILEGLNQTPGVQGSLIVGKDGLVIASSGDMAQDPDFLGATTAEIFSAAESGVMERFERGELELLSLEATGGHLFFKNINEVTYLLVLTREDVNLGLIRFDIRRAAQQLQEQL
ncbi:MAG: roadblock/LC7 domain-containing protein [Candidatus Eremiobacterota bacterium]